MGNIRHNLTNRRSRPFWVSAALIAFTAQAGRLPLGTPAPDESVCRAAAAASIGQARACDVIVLGNSDMIVGIDQERLAAALRLGRHAGGKARIANLATPLATPTVNLWLWRRLSGGSAPMRAKLLIVGVAPVDFSQRSHGNDLALRYLFEARDVVWMIGALRLRDAATLLTYRMFPLYARQARARHFLQGDEPRVLMTAQGWLGMYRFWYQDYAVEPLGARCLERLVREAKQRSVQVVLVAPPVGPRLLRLTSISGAKPVGRRDRRGGTALSVFERTISGIAARNAVPFYNYMTREQSLRYQFADPAHLTRPSAVRFTIQLARRINRESQRESDSRRRRAQAAEQVTEESGAQVR